ncbi:metallophosphoesterase [Shewanella sediminis HAW-EB3]|uniref:Metallophosphoesterase n=1 Tax=Shewanella sediminis (strain HAW-EB3) TaxID=425104 RepID=A8FZH2_SHESH|nr:metallophosphoesterase [Shewanella sediminis]ABV38245.1 metallophosphoesterase [Shewanella sediminis HAW-EB3]
MKLLDTMKLLHVSDLHFNQAQFEWVSEQASHYDVLCISGDLLDDSWHQTASSEEQIDWITQWTLTLQLPTFICSGNHDQLQLENNEQPSAHWLRNLKSNQLYLDNNIIDLGSYRFGCIPYENPNFHHFRDCDVLLHHVPPSKLKVAKQGGDDWGCPDIRAAIQFGELQAKYILCGHVHHPKARFSKFKNKFISNPGNNPSSEKPNFNSINLTAVSEK